MMWLRVMLGAAMVLAAGARAEEPGDAAAPAKPAREPIYDESADVRPQIAEALARAQRENKRVLLMFGGNWCGWCHKLHDVFTGDKGVAKVLRYEYELVLVDIGRRDKHMDVATGYGVDLGKEGVPFLTVLDGDGKLLANQETGSLEAGERHDPEKVLGFLNRWAAPPRDARQVLDAAVARAKSQGKLLFVHLGAPWCGWCRKLDEFLARKDVAAILHRDYIDVKLDLERMSHAPEVAGRFRSNADSGLPWFAFVDAEGTVLATSEGPQGNVGFPAAPEEIAHFKSVLGQTSKSIKPDEMGILERALQAAAKPSK